MLQKYKYSLKEIEILLLRTAANAAKFLNLTMLEKLLVENIKYKNKLIVSDRLFERLKKDLGYKHSIKKIGIVETTLPINGNLE